MKIKNILDTDWYDMARAKYLEIVEEYMKVITLIDFEKFRVCVDEAEKKFNHCNFFYSR